MTFESLCQDHADVHTIVTTQDPAMSNAESVSATVDASLACRKTEVTEEVQVALARKNLHVTHVFRFYQNPSVDHMKVLIEDGNVYRVKSVRNWRDQIWRVFAEEWRHAPLSAP